MAKTMVKTRVSFKARFDKCRPNVDTQKCVASDLIWDQKHGHEMKGVSTQQLLRQCNNKGTVAVPWKLDKKKMTMFEKALSKAIGPWDLKSPYQWTTRSHWLSPSDAKLGATRHTIDTRRSRRIVDYLRLGRSNIAEMAIIASWPQSGTARHQLEAALHLMSSLRRLLAGSFLVSELDGLGRAVTNSIVRYEEAFHTKVRRMVLHTFHHAVSVIRKFGPLRCT